MIVSYKLIVMFFMLFYIIHSRLAIIIGFTNTSYTVDEDIGTLQVDVRVLNVPGDQPLPASVDVVIQSVSGSASKCTELVYMYLKVLKVHFLIH